MDGWEKVKEECRPGVVRVCVCVYIWGRGKSTRIMICICVTHLTNTCTKIPVAGAVSVQVFTAEDVTDGDTVSALASISGKN